MRSVISPRSRGPWRSLLGDALGASIANKVQRTCAIVCDFQRPDAIGKPLGGYRTVGSDAISAAAAAAPTAPEAAIAVLGTSPLEALPIAIALGGGAGGAALACYAWYSLPSLSTGEGAAVVVMATSTLGALGCRTEALRARLQTTTRTPALGLFL
eukprot:CAMPEP_0170332898 /NCGR_PEP_ID=MMETSP0116_2-20130129/67464_1 /TAXON_ID=400756 /ORGANISM="Durinskia baltica, Strain CSIRO CS-38" /LENGTH=155 /DNA_ID=CAMNT_0010586231 /DNA_START=100 /DNA_END=565 /DNA_ORIENTATION=-